MDGRQTPTGETLINSQTEKENQRKKAKVKVRRRKKVKVKVRKKVKAKEKKEKIKENCTKVLEKTLNEARRLNLGVNATGVGESGTRKRSAGSNKLITSGAKPLQFKVKF